MNVSSILRSALGLVATALACFAAYWAMWIITIVLSWLLIALGVALAGYVAYNAASTAGYDWLTSRAASVLGRVRTMRTVTTVEAV